MKKEKLSKQELIKYKKSLKLTPQQRQILVGILLGDATLQSQDRRRTYRLIYAQGGKNHQQYLFHIYEIFKPWVLLPPYQPYFSHKNQQKKPDCVASLDANRSVTESLQQKEGLGCLLCPKKSGKASRYGNSENFWKFSTCSHGSFRYYGQLFYTRDPLKKGSASASLQDVKKVPALIKKLLTPMGLAYWYMDDGSMESKQSKGVILNTHSFTLFDVKFLCNILKEKFELMAKPRQQKSKNGNIYYQIYISGHSYERLKDLIKPFLIP